MAMLGALFGALGTVSKPAIEEGIKDRFLRHADVITDEMAAIELSSEVFANNRGQLSPEEQHEFDAFDNTQTATQQIGDDAEELYDEITEAIEALHEMYDLIEKVRQLQVEVTAYNNDSDHTSIREKLIDLQTA